MSLLSPLFLGHAKGQLQFSAALAELLQSVIWSSLHFIRHTEVPPLLAGDFWLYNEIFPFKFSIRVPRISRSSITNFCKKPEYYFGVTTAKALFCPGSGPLPRFAGCWWLGLEGTLYRAYVCVPEEKAACFFTCSSVSRQVHLFCI